MKKLLGIVVLGLLLSSNANADIELTNKTTINDLLKNGYKITNQDIVTSQDSRRFIKVFTLQNRSSLIICNVAFERDGGWDGLHCYKP